MLCSTLIKGDLYFAVCLCRILTGLISAVVEVKGELFLVGDEFWKVWFIRSIVETLLDRKGLWVAELSGCYWVVRGLRRWDCIIKFLILMGSTCSSVPSCCASKPQSNLDDSMHEATS